MNTKIFPDLSLEGWQGTRDTLWGYARVFAAIRRDTAAPDPFWWHVTLHGSPTGLTTTEVPFGGSSFELGLDLMSQRAFLNRDAAECRSWPLAGQTPDDFFDQTIEALGSCGIELSTAKPDMPGSSVGEWDEAAVDRFRQAFAQIDSAFQEFRHDLDGKTSPVQLFGHHFDLSLSWFSGRLVEGVDPADLESATEQMTFGFSTGDDSFAEPYFYATAYPEPDGFVGSPLPDPAFWNNQGFSGAVLLYSALRESGSPTELLAKFLRAAQRAAANLMSL
jgi:hypothetical protein